MLTTNKIADYFEKKGIDYQIHKPWDDNEKIVIVANWNNVPDKLTRLIEDNFEIDWEDESAECIECYKHIHTTPGYYGDIPKFVFVEDGYICKDCFLKNEEDLTEFISYSDDKQTAKAGYNWMKPLIDKAGFIPFVDDNNDVIEYEHGFHYGQNDTPEKVKKAIFEKHGSVEVLFVISDIGQFDLEFIAYYKKENI